MPDSVAGPLDGVLSGRLVDGFAQRIDEPVDLLSLGDERRRELEWWPNQFRLLLAALAYVNAVA